MYDLTRIFSRTYALRCITAGFALMLILALSPKLAIAEESTGDINEASAEESTGDINEASAEESSPEDLPSVFAEEDEEPDSLAAEFLDSDPEENYRSSNPLEEVIVTSTKRETSLQTTPVAVSAFSQDALDREKALDITNIADLVPNLQVGESPSDSGVSIAIRGISSNNYTEIGDPTVGIHVDGVFTPRPQAALALLHDVARVEINRGPQGTLFGRNSTAGSINIISARPAFDEYAGNIEVDVASFRHYTFKGWANLALSDSFAMRVSFLSDISGSHLNQRQDNFDFQWDGNNDGDFNDFNPNPEPGRTIDFDSSLVGTPNPQCALDANQRNEGEVCLDVPPDGIANNDQNRAREVSGRDVYGATDRYAIRLNTLLSTSDSYEWLLSFDYFRDSSPGGFSLKDCEKSAGTFFACEGSQWDVNINTPGTLDFRLFTIRTELKADLTDNLRIEFRAGNSRQSRNQYYDSDAGIRGDPAHPAYGLGRDGIDAVSSAYTARFGEGASVEHTLVGGPNGDNQYILDILGFPGSTIPLWEDQSLITRYSNYDSRVFELQFSSIADPDNSVEWIAGVFFLHEDNSIRFDVESQFNFGAIKRPIALAFVQPNRDIESLATFAQLDVPFSESFRMTFGARWTLDSKSDTGGLNYRTIGYWEAANAYTSPVQRNEDGTPVVNAEGVVQLTTVAGFPKGQGEPGAVPEVIPYHAYDLVGLIENPELFQADDFTLDQGTYSPEILERILSANGGVIHPNTFEDTWAQWTWKVGFDYIINDRWFLYGYVATGYKAGGFTDQVDLCGGQCGDEPILDAFPYDPERNITYELGVKATLFDSERAGTMNMIITAFVSNISDYQVTTFATLTPAGAMLETESGKLVEVSNSVGNLLTYNIGESRNAGLEIEFDWWNPWPDGHIYGWVTYLNAEVRDLLASDGYFCLERAYLGLTPCPAPDPNVPDDPGTSEDESRRFNFKGSKLPWAPEVAFSVFIEHNFRLGSSGLRFSPYLSMHWSDVYFFSHNNFDEGPLHGGQPAYWSFSLSLRLIDDERNWRFELYGYNLTDERIRVWQDGGPGFVRSNFNPPRNYGLKFVWGF